MFGKAIMQAYMSRPSQVWERMDQFSTLMLGGAAVAVALLGGNISVVQRELGPWQVRITLWILSASLLAGLAKKYLAFSARLSAAFAGAREVVVKDRAESIDRSKESMSEMPPNQIAQKFLAPFAIAELSELSSRVSKLFQTSLKKFTSRMFERNDSSGQNQFGAMMWRRLLVFAQLWLLAVAMVVATTSVWSFCHLIEPGPK